MPTLTEKAVELIAYLDKNAKQSPKVDDPPTVGELLTRSRAQHLIYRRSLPHRANGVTVAGDPVAVAEAVAATARLRAEAEVLDPHHVDSAWADDLAAKFPHTALMEFYEGEVKYYVPPVPDVKPIEETPKPVEDVKDEEPTLIAVKALRPRKASHGKAR